MSLLQKHTKNTIVISGLDIFLSERIKDIKDSRVGVLANHTSVTCELVHISDALIAAGISLKAMYAPEHGIRGDIAAGVKVSDCIDERSGVLVHSLYGSFEKSMDIDLSNIDVMLIDLQDVGARYYTHLSIAKSVIEACARAGVSVWILDRPNPISGLSPEGPMLDGSFTSIVGVEGIPVRHSLTFGEVVKLICSKSNIACDLEVIQMKNWSRDMWYDSTGLQWVMPSPNIPTINTATVYPGTCLLEGTNVSEGRGTTRPFEQFGAPWIDSQKLQNMLKSYDLPGAIFRETFFSPTDSKFKSERCAGVQIHIIDRDIYQPVMTGVAVISALAGLYKDDFKFNPPSDNSQYFFDQLAGNSWIRQEIINGTHPRQIAEIWAEDLAEYTADWKESFLYD